MSFLGIKLVLSVVALTAKEEKQEKLCVILITYLVIEWNLN